MEAGRLTISDKVTPYIYSMTEGNDISEKANIFMVIGMFAAKTVSLEKAAELAEKSVWEFIDILKSYSIPWGEYTELDSKLDEISLSKLGDKAYE